MAIIDEPQFRHCDDPADSDDFRPDSAWAVAVDPTRPDGRFVQDLCVAIDIVAPGDKVPLHTHRVDEVIYLQDGPAEVTLGACTRRVHAGAVIFVPAGTPHGARNTGGTSVRFVGVFPTTRVGMVYLERNPVPGTELDPPMPPTEWDLRADAGDA